jgi:kynureninase
MNPTPGEFRPDERYAAELDAADGLAAYRERFRIPLAADGRPSAYFCGNSLGLQPVRAETLVREEMEDWSRLAVDGHFDARRPWFKYHEQFREPTARLVGALPGEVVVMNGLTVNLHLMLVSFFRPEGKRRCILMEENAFPSDTYAAQSQLALHGLDPSTDLLIARAREGETAVRTEDFAELLDRHGDRISLVLLGGVNYYSGQLFDLPRITRMAHDRGCAVGLDLAHAAGNVPLRLHDWDVDFAVWCSYKYLNAGPGAVAGCFVHERRAADPDLLRLGGWWGNDPETRFRMHLEERFRPVAGADSWQLSNPPVLALAPLLASLEIFDEVGMDALREKSQRLTGYLEAWVDHVADLRVEIITPRDPAARGCQLSLLVRERGKDLFAAVQAAAIVGDYREPDVVRVAPVPLYNSFHDIWRLGRALAGWAGA